VPPVIFGVAFGNLLQGVPFQFDEYLMSTYTGSFWGLLNPFALLAGVVSLAMITTQGANYLMMRTEGDIYRRVRTASLIFAMLTIATFALAGVWIATGIEGYVITSVVDPGALPDPLAKTVEVQAGAWLHNYTQYAWAMYVPIAAFAALTASVLFSRLHQAGAAFWSSSLACAGIIGTAGVSMFPFVMPSSLDPRSSLTAYDAVSSHLTLGLMLGATVIFMPLIVFYTAWAYKVMWGKVTIEYIAANDKSVY
jgi:cytochrome bd ubiquinol oxidase subunit II